MRMLSPIGAAFIAATLGLTASTAFAASAVQKECSTKYQAAKSANTLNGMTYNQYYKQCAADAKAAKAAPEPATPAATAPAPAPAPVTPPPTTTAAKPAPAPTTTAAKPAPAPTASAAGGAVFPTAIAPEFSKLTPHAARMKTCAQQWQKNKLDNTTGGMKWNPKGGGYYSECNTKLKG